MKDETNIASSRAPYFPSSSAKAGHKEKSGEAHHRERHQHQQQQQRCQENIGPVALRHSLYSTGFFCCYSSLPHSPATPSVSTKAKSIHSRIIQKHE